MVNYVMSMQACRAIPNDAHNMFINLNNNCDFFRSFIVLSGVAM